jgi:hypothetical protein
MSLNLRERELKDEIVFKNDMQLTPRTFQEKLARADDAGWQVENLFLKTFSPGVKHSPFALAHQDFSI